MYHPSACMRLHSHVSLHVHGPHRPINKGAHNHNNTQSLIHQIKFSLYISLFTVLFCLATMAIKARLPLLILLFCSVFLASVSVSLTLSLGNQRKELNLCMGRCSDQESSIYAYFVCERSFQLRHRNARDPLDEQREREKAREQREREEQEHKREREEEESEHGREQEEEESEHKREREEEESEHEREQEEEESEHEREREEEGGGGERKHEERGRERREHEQERQREAEERRRQKEFKGERTQKGPRTLTFNS